VIGRVRYELLMCLIPVQRRIGTVTPQLVGCEPTLCGAPDLGDEC
jgi:hypothetical protein